MPILCYLGISLWQLSVCFRWKQLSSQHSLHSPGHFSSENPLCVLYNESIQHTQFITWLSNSLLSTHLWAYRFIDTGIVGQKVLYKCKWLWLLERSSWIIQSSHMLSCKCINWLSDLIQKNQCPILSMMIDVSWIIFLTLIFILIKKAGWTMLWDRTGQIFIILVSNISSNTSGFSTTLLYNQKYILLWDLSAHSPTQVLWTPFLPVPWHPYTQLAQDSEFQAV